MVKVAFSFDLQIDEIVRRAFSRSPSECQKKGEIHYKTYLGT